MNNASYRPYLSWIDLKWGNWSFVGRIFWGLHRSIYLWWLGKIESILFGGCSPRWMLGKWIVLWIKSLCLRIPHLGMVVSDPSRREDRWRSTGSCFRLLFRDNEEAVTKGNQRTSQRFRYWLRTKTFGHRFGWNTTPLVRGVLALCVKFTVGVSRCKKYHASDPSTADAEESFVV